MDRRALLKNTSITVVALAVGAGIQQTTKRASASGQISRENYQDTLAALRPPKRDRPVVTVVIEADGSESTDTLIPFGILSQSDVVDVSIISDTTDAVRLFPALTIRPQFTLDAFEDQYPDGPDYVIVPAGYGLRSSPLIPWISKQASSGATIIGLCGGAKNRAVPRLLNGWQVKTHCFELDHLRRLEPDLIHVPDRRYEADVRVINIAGSTASVPVSLALVEAIGGRQRVEHLRDDLGIPDWTAKHNSGDFRVSTGAFFTGLSNRFSPRRHIGIPVEDGISEIAIGLTADAWSRTYRSKVFTVATQAVVQSCHGLELIPDRRDETGLQMENAVRCLRPGTALDEALEQIKNRFGWRTAELVALQLEYPLAQR